MNPFVKLWFWFLIVSIIGFIVSIVLFETQSTIENNQNIFPIWVWSIFIVSIIIFVIAFILFVVAIVAYYEQLEINEACGLNKCKKIKVIRCPYSCPEREYPKIECSKKIECSNAVKNRM
jgi:hypothetical protein